MEFNFIPAALFNVGVKPVPRSGESGQGVRGETLRPVPRSLEGSQSRTARDENDQRGRTLDILV
jgi:hypothetical protein